MKQSFTSWKLFFLFISVFSCQILSNESEITYKAVHSSYFPINSTDSCDNSPEILKQMGNILIGFINLSQKKEATTEDVVPALAQAFSGMLNIVALASKRSMSIDQQIALLSVYLQTEDGKSILQKWHTLIAQQIVPLS